MTGQRSQLVAAKLRKAGFEVWNVRGGLVDWQAQKLPLESAPQVLAPTHQDTTEAP